MNTRKSAKDDFETRVKVGGSNVQFNQNLTNGKEALKRNANVLRLTEQTSTVIYIPTT